MSRPRSRCLASASVVVALLCASSPAFAISITSETVSLGGTTYRSVYSVTNDGSLGVGVAVGLFDILFDPAVYLESSLAIVTPTPLNTEWDQLILASGPGVFPAFDALALAGGIAEGDTVSGFALEYDWLGAGTPGVQPFEVYDPDTFELLEQGQTVTGSVTVPEPGAVWLLAIGLVSLLGITRAVRA